MPAFNFHTTGAEVIDAFPEQIAGKTFLITGPSAASLGANTALALAKGEPAAFILLGRTLSKVQPVIDEIKSLSPDTKVDFVQVDLSSFANVRIAATNVQKILGTMHKIDVILNMAGLMALPEYTTSTDGIEMQFATNHLGPFLLTNLLLKSSLLAPHGRIVNVSSAGHALGTPYFPDVNFNAGADYDEWKAYGASKAANVLYSHALAERGFSSVSLHPGNIFETSIGRHVQETTDWNVVMKRFDDVGRAPPGVKTMEEGISTVLVACLDPALEESNGAYVEDCVVGRETEFAASEENAEKLWEVSEKLVGEEFVF